MCRVTANSVNKSIPQYGLYGEPGWIDDPEFIHIEDIRRRSSALGWFIGAHRHGRLFQLICIDEGAVEVHLDDRVANLESPCVITIPTGVVHSFRFAPESEGAVVTLADPLLLETEGDRALAYFGVLFAEPGCIPFAQRGSECSRLKMVLQQLKDEFAQARSGRGLMCEWLIRILLMTIYRQQEANGQLEVSASAPSMTAGRLKFLIERNFKEHWTVEQYANAIGTTVSRLNRLSRSLMNQTVSQMIQARLVLEVKRRLIYTRATLDEIAADMGFKDPGYFSRYFKRAVGMPPGRFRKENNFDTTAE